MKTSLVVCLLSLSLALTLLAQSPAAPQNPPAGGAPAAAAPGAAAATSPEAAAATSPGAAAVTSPGAAAVTSPGAAAATSPGAPGESPAAAAAAASSPAAAAPQPAAEAQPSGGVLGSNWLIDKFHKGGPVMWPILIVSIIALTVVIERIFWWSGRWFRRDPKRIEKVFTAIENGDVTEGSRLSRDSRDPVLRMMWNGIGR